MFLVSPEFSERLARLESGHGNAKDMLHVGLRYLDGRGVEPNIAAGLAWLERAAEMRDSEAIAQLAMLYEAGDLIPVDCDKARAYYAALEGDEDFTGPYMLALAHYFGSDCMPRDEAVAFC